MRQCHRSCRPRQSGITAARPCRRRCRGGRRWSGRGGVAARGATAAPLPCRASRRGSACGRRGERDFGVGARAHHGEVRLVGTLRQRHLGPADGHFVEGVFARSLAALSRRGWSPPIPLPAGEEGTPHRRRRTYGHGWTRPCRPPHPGLRARGSSAMARPISSRRLISSRRRAASSNSRSAAASRMRFSRSAMVALRLWPI